MSAPTATTVVFASMGSIVTLKRLAKGKGRVHQEATHVVLSGEAETAPKNQGRLVSTCCFVMQIGTAPRLVILVRLNFTPG